MEFDISYSLLYPTNLFVLDKKGGKRILGENPGPPFKLPGVSAIVIGLPPSLILPDSPQC